MTFYKLYDHKTKQDIHLNPNTIAYYVYYDTYVEIYLLSQECFCIDKLDFMNMLFLEGGQEYWNTHSIIEYQLTISIRLFY